MNTPNRKGIATSELAIALPIIIVITLAVLETCTVVFLKEAVTIAAYEGARVGIRKQGTDAMVTARVTEFLNSRNIQYESDFLSISSPGFDDAETLEHVTVTVTVPCNDNTYTNWFFTGSSVAGSVTMRKEFENL